MKLKNRIDAGEKLAEKIVEIINEKNVLVLAIPRGGVIIGQEIAKKLHCPMDVIISKKITPPRHPEYAIGSITHDGTIFQSENWKMFSQEPGFEDEINQKKLEVKRRLEEYRGISDYDFKEKTVILVDDGIATGATVIVLLKWIKKKKVRKIILAVPVIPKDTLQKIKSMVDTIVSLETPREFLAVGQFYNEFEQIEDEEVMSILSNFKKIGDKNGLN